MASSFRVEDVFWPSHQRQDSRELINSIYDVVDIPSSVYEHHQAAAAHSLNGSRPNSIISSQSSSNYGTWSNQSLHSSLPSSRTSYSSNASSDSFRGHLQPFGLEGAATNSLDESRNNHNRTSSKTSLTRKFQSVLSPGTVVEKQEPPPPGTDFPIREGGNSTAAGKRSRCCPWCKRTFTRPHDCKKHVKEFCCGRKYWVCQNLACKHRTWGRKEASVHSNHSKDPRCKSYRSAEVELQCERKHFGCPYCEGYFDDLSKFLDHFGQSCKPDGSRGKGHWSRQIRALLQQPELLPLVEALCVQLRRSRDAYKGLWWTWNGTKMCGLIEQLEYGPKTKVDHRNPGIAYVEIESFLRKLIQPSDKSVLAADLVHELTSGSMRSKYKALPELPSSAPETFAPRNFDSSNINKHATQGGLWTALHPQLCEGRHPVNILDMSTQQDHKSTCNGYVVPPTNSNHVPASIANTNFDAYDCAMGNTQELPVLQQLGDGEYLWDSFWVDRDDEIGPHDRWDASFNPDEPVDNGLDFTQDSTLVFLENTPHLAAHGHISPVLRTAITTHERLVNNLELNP